MADVKFTIKYEVNTDAPIPSPRAILTMKVKTDEDGHIPAGIRCTDRILGEPMWACWGSPHEEAGRRTKRMPIESESWPAVQARVVENILGALARMQEADARCQKLIAERPPDYVYETTVPGTAEPKYGPYGPYGDTPIPPDSPLYDSSQAPASSNDSTFDEAESPQSTPRSNQEWAQYHFGLSQLPCESASNFLLKNFVYIARYAEEAYGAWEGLSADQRYHAGIEWLVEYAEADDDDGNAYPIADWIDWAKKHRA